MNRYKKIVFSVFLISAFSFAATAQKAVAVSGTVRDVATGEFLPYVNIIDRESKTATTSDSDGKFTVSASENSVLEFSYVGYANVSEKVGKRTKIDVLLSENKQELGEVVVVGYGTQRRKELTGAISTVNSDILKNGLSASLDGLLGGSVAGVNVSVSSGQPGSGSSIRIRGGNSVNAGNEPLYVIDGFIFTNDNSINQAGLGKIEGSISPLAAINPSDIESIEILKDVSATAIYGSRGANGVIIVTTKRGIRGRNVVNYQSNFGIEQVSRRLNLMNGGQWMRYQNAYGYLTPFSEETVRANAAGYDWQDAVLRTAVSQEHQVSFSGGDNKNRYLIALAYLNQQGVLLNTDFERYNLRLNFDRNVFDNLTAGVNLNLSKSTQNSITGFEGGDATYQGRITSTFCYALRIPPVVPIYSNDGSYNYFNPYEKSDLRINDQTPNPVSDLVSSVGQTLNFNALGNFYAQYILFSNLILKADFSGNISNTTQNFFAPANSAIGLLKHGQAGIGYKRYESYQQEYTATYSEVFGDIHSLGILAGYTSQNTSIRYLTATTTDLITEQFTFNKLKAGASYYPPENDGTDSWLKSVLGRVNYTLLSRYNLTASIRADESSRFAAGHRWGFFPSVGVSWNVNEENFYAPVKDILSHLKLRLTYGSVGNQEIGDYLFMPGYVIGTASENGQLKPVITRSRLGNDKLTWETTVQYNAGLDFGLWKNRITFTTDAYYKKTSDLLYRRPLEPSTGFAYQMENVGNVTNKGAEFSVNAKIIDRRHFQWNVSANIARNINTITDLGAVNRILSGSGRGYFSDYAIILQVGESLGSFYGLVFDGVVQQGEDVSGLPQLSWKQGTPEPGDPKFLDLTPDGKIDVNDRRVLGSSQPDFTYGFSTSMKWGNFDFFVSFQGTQGNELYNQFERELESASESYNLSAKLLNAWTPNNPTNTVPRISQDLRNEFLDSRYIQDASYLRLKNLTVGYTLPVKINKLLTDINFYFSAQNLITLTKYEGYDPEIAGGTDYGIYPKTRSFSLGIKVAIK